MGKRSFGVLIHGAGWVSSQHIAAYAHHPDTQVLAISSRSLESARRRAQQAGLTDVATYDSLQEA
jgi:predicted dehydrogenase